MVPVVVFYAIVLVSTIYIRHKVSLSVRPAAFRSFFTKNTRVGSRLPREDVRRGQWMPPQVHPFVSPLN